jgi:hypothetical protein
VRKAFPEKTTILTFITGFRSAVLWDTASSMRRMRLSPYLISVRGISQEVPVTVRPTEHSPGPTQEKFYRTYECSHSAHARVEVNTIYRTSQQLPLTTGQLTLAWLCITANNNIYRHEHIAKYTQKLRQALVSI